MTRTKLEAMAAEGTLIPAVEQLLAVLRWPTANQHDRLVLALKAFETSPLDKARKALKAAGFEEFALPAHREGDVLLLRDGLHDCRVWRLNDEGAKP